jgi:hypothetical protein
MVMTAAMVMAAIVIAAAIGIRETGTSGGVRTTGS